jgi:hypothetical protein
MKKTTKLILYTISASIIFFAGFSVDRFVCMRPDVDYVPPTFIELTPPPATEVIEQIEQEIEAANQQIEELQLELPSLQELLEAAQREKERVENEN